MEANSARNTTYDIIVIGGGPAGYTAAQYAARAEKKVLLLEKMFSGGQIATTDILDNYPGFPEGIGGIEFGQALEKQARKFGVEISFEQVAELALEQDGTFLTKTAKETYATRVVILAAGVNPRMLGVPGEEEFRGRGVSYCATCDGAFFQDRDLLVVGGGDAAIEEAIYLTRFARKVMIVHRRDELRAVKFLQEKAFRHEKIDFFFSHGLKEIKGQNSVEVAILQDLVTKEEKQVKVDGVFFYVGHDPNTSFLKDISLSSTAGGFIKTSEKMETGVLGLYAIGDLRVKFLRQVITAASDGAIAAMAAVSYLEE